MCPTFYQRSTQVEINERRIEHIGLKIRISFCDLLGHVSLFHFPLKRETDPFAETLPFNLRQRTAYNISDSYVNNTVIVKLHIVERQ